jgi:hypothetical protein
MIPHAFPAIVAIPPLNPGNHAIEGKEFSNMVAHHPPPFLARRDFAKGIVPDAPDMPFR